MSSAITVYALPLVRLKQVIGSGNQATINTIVAGHSYFLTSIDEIDDEATMICAEAMAELVNGKITKNRPGYLYGYALEAICAYLGKELTNICPIARASAWIHAVDGELERKSVPVRLSTLVFGGSPVPIPEPDDSPCIGTWSASQIPAALAAFQSLDLTDVDYDMIDMFAQMMGWLEAAAKMPDAAIIGFLS